MLEHFFKLRQTELGKIKIGGKDANERTSKTGRKWRAPVKHDHFTITTMNRNGNGDLVQDTDLMAQLAKTHGDADGKLRAIPILVLSNDIEDIMQSRYVWYGGRTVGARSDGETVTFFCDPTTGKRLAEPRVNEPWKREYLELADSRGNKLFKLHTTFNCVIAAKGAEFGGVYKFRTTSVISGGQLYNSLAEIATRTFGVLMGIPLLMKVRPIQVTPNGTTTTVYVVHVVLKGDSLLAIQEQAQQQMKSLADHRDQVLIAQRRYKAMLTAPGEETSAQETTDINEEWQPETVDDEAPPEPPAEPDPLMSDTDSEPSEPDAEPGPVSDSDADIAAFEAETAEPDTGELSVEAMRACLNDTAWLDEAQYEAAYAKSGVRCESPNDLNADETRKLYDAAVAVRKQTAER